MRASHEIHVSEMRTFSSCKRKWHWSYREGWSPPWRPQFLDFGIAYHKGMESFYQPGLWYSTSVDEKVARAQSAFSLACEQQRAECIRLTGEQPDEWDENLELGLAMLDYYGRVIHPEKDNWIEPIATELPFSMKLMDPDSGEAMQCWSAPYCGQNHYQGASVTFDGTADAIVRDLEDGGLLLLDTKSTKQLSSERDEDTLYLDDQVAFYTMALRMWMGWDIRGFIYAEHRKTVPKPPRELSKSSGGCLYSRDQRQLTEYGLALETFKAGDSEALSSGLYDEYLDFLSGPYAPEYHRRFEITKSLTEMEEAKRVLEVRAADMVDSKLRIYPEPSKFTCRICPFYQPCLGKFMGEDYVFTLESLFERNADVGH